MRLFLGRREIVPHVGRAILDIAIVRLFRVDDVGSGFAAKHLERQVAGVSLCARLVSWWAGLGFRV